MKRVIAITNQKGGTELTATAVNLAASLACFQRRVLLVDLDPQGKATMGSGVDKSQLQWTSSDVLLEIKEIASALVQVEPGGYALLPANQNLAAAEVQLLARRGGGGESKLRNALEPIRGTFDVILVVSPPSPNMLTMNCLVAADSVLIPMQCEYYAMEGLSALMSTYQRLKDSVNPTLEIEGILRTKYDPRNNLAGEVSNQLISVFGDKVYRTIIRRNIRLADAPSFGKPVLYQDRQSRGALDYLDLAGEMIQREQGVFGLAPGDEGSSVAQKRGARIVPATPDKLYVGPVLDVDEAGLVQNVRGTFVRHAFVDLIAGSPALLEPGKHIKVTYTGRFWEVDPFANALPWLDA
jgi:chromosome partitioning protein